MSEKAFNNTALLSFKLAALGIVSPHQLAGLSERQVGHLAALVANTVDSMKQHNVWNPLTVPRSDQVVLLEGRSVPPRKAMHRPISELGMTVKATNTLARAEVTTIGRLIALGQTGISQIKGISRAYAREIEGILRDCNLCFAPQETDMIVSVSLAGQRVDVSARAELAGMYFPLPAISLIPHFPCNALSVTTLSDLVELSRPELEKQVTAHLNGLHPYFKPKPPAIRAIARKHAELLLAMAEYA
jgi:hypothetical protein